MTAEIPTEFRDLFDKKAFGHLATLMPDGAPQTTPVWIDYDGTHVIVNTALGRQKVENLEGDRRVSISIQDPENPYRYLEVRGRIDETTQEGADRHIDQLAKHYLDMARYPWRKPGEERVIVKIAPEHFTSMS